MKLWAAVGAETSAEKTIFVGLAVPFVLLIPFFLLLHGYTWTSTRGTSSTTLVYLMKVAPIAYVLAALLVLNVRGVLAALPMPMMVVLGVVFALGLVTPFAFGTDPSLFYVVADAVGLLATIGYVLLTFQLLKEHPNLRTVIWRTVIAGAVVTSLVIIGLYVWSGGNKVSIPPDIHYGIALGVLLYLTSTEDRFRFRLAPLILMAGVGASQFRMNMLVAAICILAAWFWLVVFNRARGALWRGLETALLLVAMIGLFSQPIIDTVSRLALVSWNPVEALEIIRNGGQILGVVGDKDLEGRAVDQRYVETFLVLNELQRQPLSFVTGKGFGATFGNDDNILTMHDAREHSVHNSLAALTLRNGLIGAGLFLMPAFFALAGCFQRRRELFVASASLLAIYLACMADQYVYWGGYFGIAIGVFFFVRRVAIISAEVPPV